jgi:hypothetical protein
LSLQTQTSHLLFIEVATIQALDLFFNLDYKHQIRIQFIKKYELYVRKNRKERWRKREGDKKRKKRRRERERERERKKEKIEKRREEMR